MRISRKLLALAVSVVLALGLSGTAAFASETTTSATVNHGTMGVYTGGSAAQDDTNIELMVGDTVSISDMDVYTDHGDPMLPDQSMGDVKTDTQTAYVTLSFDEAMKIVDKEALIEEMMATIKLHNQALGGVMGTIKNVALSEDGKSLSFELSGWTAPYSGQLTSEGTWTNLMNEEGPAYADSQMNVIMPNGLTTEVVDRTVANGDTPASVTVKIVAPESATRGMVHLIVLKNGQPVAPKGLTSYGATTTGHWHDYLTMTAEKFVESYASSVQAALGDDYTVTGNGDEITIAAKNSEPGDILDFHVLSYLNNGTKDIDTSALAKAVKDAEDADTSLWKAKGRNALSDAVAVGELMLSDPTYYSQQDVDNGAEAIERAIENTTDDDVSEEKPEPAEITEGDGGNGQQTGDAVKTAADVPAEKVDDGSAKTGDETPVAAILALLLVSGTAAAIAVRRRAS